MSSIVNDNTYVAVGRRKTATARVRLTPGSGKITINGREFEDYCCTDQLQRMVMRPFQEAEATGQFDAFVRVQGGGPVGQAAAISLGIARALQTYNAELRPQLKKAGLLKRDPRMKERKKSGQPGARKNFQFSKR